MPSPRLSDLGALDALLAERARAVSAFKQQIDTAGMTRPARSEVERAFLAQRGSLGPFVETARPSVRARRALA